MALPNSISISDESWRIGAARGHILGWSSYTNPYFRRFKHIKLMGQVLMDIANGKRKRVIISMPPRHGKSETCSVGFPAYYLGKNPQKRVMLGSYAADLATKLSARARDAYAEFAPRVFNTSVSDNTSAKNQWDVVDPDAPLGVPPGGMIAAGVGGPMTGHGYHLGIIDDPFKDAKEAQSQTIRDNVWDWYRFVFRTRMMEDGAILIIMTRWHEDDLVGRLLKESEAGTGEQWEVINIPCEAEDNDPLNRRKGEPLCPELGFGKDWMVQTKKGVGRYVWSALYQGKPTPDGGSIFLRSWFRYFRQDALYYILSIPDDSGTSFKEKRIEKKKCWIFQTCDPAATENESSDYFVNSTWAVTPEKDLLWLGMFREKAETTKHKIIMFNEFKRWKPRFQAVEKKSYGLNIIQDMRRDGRPVRPLKADTDKVSRARPMAARYEVGSVYHLESASWLDDAENELIGFPNAPHDDIVDTAGYAGIVIAETPKTGPKNKPKGW